MQDIDIAIVVALDEEYQTIRRNLDIRPQHSSQRTHFFELSDSLHAPISLVIHVTGEMGLVPSANATDLILSKFRPRWLVSIGISGQLSSDCALGDVVLATACDLAYNEARKSVGGTEFSGKVYEISGLTSFLKSVDLSKYLQGRELAISTACKEELKERRLWRKYPLVHQGIICSTDFVVDDPNTKSELLRSNRRFLCTDMESGAMASAARKNNYGGNLVIIRAVSDPADGTKRRIDSLAGNGTFRKYAMGNATTLLLHSVIKQVEAQDSFPEGRPLITQFIGRIEQIDRILRGSASIEEATFEIDSDLNFYSIDTEISRYIYRERISRQHDEVPKPLARAINSLDDDQVADFYIALHVIRSLEAPFESLPELLIPLTHVHTHPVNQFCKALIQSAERRLQLSAMISRIGAAYEAASTFKLESSQKSNLHAHLCYLLGRITANQSWQRAVQMLQAWRDELIPQSPPKKRSSTGKRATGVTVATLERLQKAHLLQYRSIQISLVQLGVDGESDNYILSCLGSSELDAQNRGFHLEYYRDIPYDPAQPLSNEDGLRPCPRTLAVIGDKLLVAFSTCQRHPLLDIELYTVISLLRSRLQKGVLAEADRKRGLEILSRAKWVSKNKKLPMLLDRIRSDLSTSGFHPLGVVDELFSLKKLRRSGWSARGREVKDAESVASHTFGGLTIIELFLPESGTLDARSLGRDYSKEKVMRLFLKHDWAEASIGDLLPNQRDELVAVAEDAAFRRLGTTFMYAPYANKSIYEDWDSFERGEGINSRLARDVDQLDNLLQLLIESRAAPDAIRDRDSWIEYINQRVKTDWGRSLFTYFISRK